MSYTLDDTDIYKKTYSPVCQFCKHLKKGKDRSCKAFKVIPDKIWDGKNEHTKPLKTQGNKLVFEKK